MIKRQHYKTVSLKFKAVRRFSTVFTLEIKIRAPFSATSVVDTGSGIASDRGLFCRSSQV
jgi:hypothetical protein